MKTDTIKIDVDKNIVVQKANQEGFVINTAKADDIHQKLQQLDDRHIAVLLQVINEQGDNLSDIFKTLLNGVASQKNVVHGNIEAKSVKMGDEIHYHFYPKEKTHLPKKLTLSIPTLSPGVMVGRTKDMDELRDLLVNNRQALVLNGLGGIGKTTLAQGYADKYWEEYNHIAWVTQIPDNSFLLNFINVDGLRKNLGIRHEFTDPLDIFNEMVRKLNALERFPNLLILDNVNDSIEKYRDRLPSAPEWHLLLTSRLELSGFSLKRLDFLNPDDAFLLFKKHYPLTELNDTQIQSLVKSLDYHTLCIEILAKMAVHQRYDFEILENALNANAAANVKINRPGSAKIERITSFLTTVFSLSQLNKDEIWLMQQIACLPSEYHSYNLLLQLIEPETGNRKEIFAQTLNELCQKGWLLKNEAIDSVKMHLVIVEVIKEEQPPNLSLIKTLMENIITRLDIDQTKDNPIDKFPWIPFGRSVLSAIEKQTSLSREEENKAAELQNNLALVLQNLGEYEEAKTLLEKAVKSSEKNFGKDHPSTAISYSNLALVLQDLGEYEEAKPLLEKAVESDEKNFGKDHPSTANSYSNLATVLQDLGEYEEAKTLLEKAVESDEKNFGKDHPSTARSYSNLATVLQNLGEYEEAKTLLEKAMKSDEKNFGKDHPSTAISYSNLALVLQDLGEYEEAKTLLEKAVKSSEKNFGKDHPSTARSYSNLALVLQGLGEYEEAKTLLEKAVKSSEKNFGKDHPSTAISYSNLALVLQDLGEYEEAKTLLEKAVKSDKKNFGKDHPSTARSYSNLALVLKDLGEYEEAKTLLEKAVESDEKNFGKDHPSTARSYSNLALVLQGLGEYEEAKTLLEKAMKSDEKNFGKDHPSTAISYSNLALVLQDLGEYEGAKTLLEKAVESDEKNFGKDHPSTANSYSNLATVLQDLGEYEEALKLSGKAVAVFENILPPGHPNISKVKNNYNYIKQQMG